MVRIVGKLAFNWFKSGTGSCAGGFPPDFIGDLAVGFPADLTGPALVEKNPHAARYIGSLCATDNGFPAVVNLSIS